MINMEICGDVPLTEIQMPIVPRIGEDFYFNGRTYLVDHVVYIFDKKNHNRFKSVNLILRQRGQQE